MLKNSQYLTILFNFEGSVKNNQAAVGFVIRDENARVLLAGAKKIGDVSITVVECIWTLEMVWPMLFLRVGVRSWFRGTPNL